MNSEKPLQDAYIDLLNKLELPWLHIPNRAFSKNARVRYDSLGGPCTKSLPDIMFCFKGKMYFRELGIKGRHLDNKADQLFKMGWWASHCDGDVLIINNEDGMREDWEKIGLTANIIGGGLDTTNME